MRKTVFYSSSTAVIVRIIGLGLQSILMIYFARTTLVTNLAVVTTIMTVMSIFIVILDFGGRTLAPIEFAKNNLKVVREILNLNWITSILIILVGSIIVYFLHVRISLPVASLLFIIWFSLEKFCETIMGLTASTQQYIILFNSMLIRKGLPPLFYYLLLKNSIDSLVALGLALSSGALVGLFHSLRNLKKWHLMNRTEFNSVFQTVKNTNQLSQTTLFDQLPNIDVLLIALFGGAFQAGLYSGVIRLINPFYLISDTVFAATRPMVVHMDEIQRKSLRKRFMQFFLFASGCSILAALNSERLIDYILGPKYESAGIYLTLSFLLLPSIITSRGLQSFLMSLDKMIIVNKMARISFLVSLILTAVLAQIFGTLGIYLGIYAQFFFRNIYLFRQVDRALLEI